MGEIIYARNCNIDLDNLPTIPKKTSNSLSFLVWFFGFDFDRG